MDSADFDAVIFDCDGTLALTADLHFTAFNVALARQGARMTRDWYESRRGLDRRDLLSSFIDAHPVRLDFDRVVADSIDATLDIAADSSRPNPPVANLAARLHGKVPIAVASNAETPITRAILKGAGLDALFDTIVTVTDAGRPKPDPAMFLMAARALNTTPERCLILEDSAEGISAARAIQAAVWDVRNPTVIARLGEIAQDDSRTAHGPA